MAAFPPIPQIVGKHGGVFEAYFKQADPKNSGSVGALDAATFMKKSGLKDTTLSQIWDLSDPSGKGYLVKPGFFVALKLISMVQNGLEPSVSKLTIETPPPNLGPVEVAPEVPAGAGGPWTVSASEKAKYDQVFDSLQPVNGFLAGDKVKPVLINSKLPVDVLGRIWDLSDVDKDGYLDRDEFALAMHLVYKGMEKESIPTTLPPQMVPPSKRKSVPGSTPMPGAVPVLPSFSGPGSGRNTPVQRADSPSIAGGYSVPWVVSAADKANFDVMFRKADLDMDGFVSGQEIRDIFLQSGLPNNVLANIWGLCDMKSIGKLNSEQFALAIYLVQQKLKGVDPPPQLPLEMIPPSMRPKQATDTATFGVADGGTSAGPYGHVADFSSIKELDMIAKEIEDIKKEKMLLEQDQAQKNADIKICQGELQTQQKELDAITSTLHQLESQKKDAQKCLDELDDKKSKLETNVREMKQKIEDEQKQIDNLKSQLQNQEKSAQDQETELSSLRVQLNNLRDEENQLEQKVESGKQQLELLSKSHKDLQLQVNQTRTRVQHLQDQYRAVQQGIAGFSADTEDNAGSLSSAPPDDQFSTRATGSPVSTISNFSMGSLADDFKEDPFKNKDPFGGGSTSSQADPFQSEDPFKSSDPFKAEGFTSDPFAAEDPFKDTFSSSSSATTAPTNKKDPFSGMDPFGSSFSNSPSIKKSTDAFDPFASSSSSSSASSRTQKSGGDLFGSDPFAPKPSSRDDSPRPALPPKQKKAPPPRPAPPKGKASPAKSPSKPSVDPFGGFSSDPFAGSDPFSSNASNSGSTAGGGGSGDSFANFADFSPSKSSFSDNSSAWAFQDEEAVKKRQKAKEQEEADYKYALALSRGEINDSEA